MSILKNSLVSDYQNVAEAATANDANEILKQVRGIRAEGSDDAPIHNLAVESAFRGKLIELIAALDIEEDDFSPIWSLLDAINLLCDNNLCDLALGFWLIEDLLDSQTIKGSLEVVRYLETRRERMTKVNFDQKKLSILRCCNELLRRLSRAEDIVFCGRVFIYLFQCFPLGDKSSVNLRGEFHIENVTAYDEQNGEEMQLDTESPSTLQENNADTSTSLRQLYPVFWSLQSLFSSPTKLFDESSMQSFKNGMKQTLDCFSKVASHSAISANIQDPEKRGQKRKRDDGETDSTEFNASTFNPKYLTNQDLFALEVQDIDFRRHVLVQALILLDFLLSLSKQSKAKLSIANPSKSIMSTLYDKYTLTEDDKAWALDMRKQIEKYLEEGNGAEGRYYLRMVNMVLSRDRNWALWKAEGCPLISKPAVVPTVEEESQKSLERVTEAANASLRIPKGSDQLVFLSNSVPLEELKTKRVRIPTMEEYYENIQREELDLDFAVDDQEKREIEERKAGHLWRALRSAKGRRFQLCEDLKDGDGALVGKTKGTDDNEPQDQSTEPDQAKNGDVVEGSAGDGVVKMEA